MKERKRLHKLLTIADQEKKSQNNVRRIFLVDSSHRINEVNHIMKLSSDVMVDTYLIMVPVKSKDHLLNQAVLFFSAIKREILIIIFSFFGDL